MLLKVWLGGLLGLAMLVAGIVYFSPRPLWSIDKGWYPCLEQAAKRYRDARLAANYCIEQETFTPDQWTYSAEARGVRKMVEDNLTRDAAILIAQQRRD